MTLSGLPKSFEPGTTYDIVLSWTTPTAPQGLNLEVVDVEGRAAGELALPATADLTADDRCTFTDDPILSVSPYTMPPRMPPPARMAE